MQIECAYRDMVGDRTIEMWRAIHGAAATTSSLDPRIVTADEEPATESKFAKVATTSYRTSSGATCRNPFSFRSLVIRSETRLGDLKPDV